MGPMFYVVALFITCGLSGTAAGISAITQTKVQAKIALLYAGIAIEIFRQRHSEQGQLSPSRRTR